QLLTEFGRATLNDRYLMPGEGYQDLFARVASYYGDDAEHAQRLYDYISKLWFMPATPVLSNGGTKRGLPISCFLNEASDSLEGIVDLWNENVWLASKGGGIGSYWGNLRSIGEKVGQNGKTSGVVPFIRVMDSLTLAISQGSLRRGSAAVYLPISHPEVEEFIEIRRPTGGDPNRKALNLHHGILVSDAFMRAVEADEMWSLTSPKDGAHVRSVSARSLWIRILTARIETGEPYIIFGDHVNNARPEHHKLAGLEVKTSNLCAEITLPTGLDQHGQQRTAVCCLSSINLETWLEWHDNPQFIEDVMRFLDNVLQDFIDNAPDSMARAKYAAMRERSVGLGVMGFHSLLQALGIPFESAMAKAWNIRIFRHIRAGADAASRKLAEERGPCPDAAEYGVMERFSHKMAIAPTASISIIAGNSSPGIEPIAANVFLQKTLSGSFSVRNRHLQLLLAAKGRDDEETWSNITVNKGSVQHLDFLTDDEKAVFKTAFELDQRWVIEHAADRTPYICQSQSINVFLPANVHKRDLHQIHFQAWKKGVKSLYYCRSLSIQRADTVSEKVQRHEHGDAAPIAKLPPAAAATSTTDYEECLACQ
ncbi:MAG: ribonucleotide-diphosphate reductase subunit alpha, partial [Acidiphilium sp. 21-68-69]